MSEWDFLIWYLGSSSLWAALLRSGRLGIFVYGLSLHPSRTEKHPLKGLRDSNEPSRSLKASKCHIWQTPPAQWLPRGKAISPMSARLLWRKKFRKRLAMVMPATVSVVTTGYGYSAESFSSSFFATDKTSLLYNDQGRVTPLYSYVGRSNGMKHGLFHGSPFQIFFSADLKISIHSGI